MLSKSKNNNLLKARNEGLVSKDTPDKDRDDYVSKLSYQNGCMSMLNQPPTTDAFNFLDNSMRDAQHPKG